MTLSGLRKSVIHFAKVAFGSPLGVWPYLLVCWCNASHVAEGVSGHIMEATERDGSLTLMYMASLMFLVMLCASCPLGEIVHTDALPLGVTMVIDGGNNHEVLLEPFFNSPCRLLYVFFFAIHLVSLVPVDYPIFLSNIISILKGQKEVLDSVASFEMYWAPTLLQTFLKLLLRPFVYGTTM